VSSICDLPFMPINDAPLAHVVTWIALQAISRWGFYDLVLPISPSDNCELMARDAGASPPPSLPHSLSLARSLARSCSHSACHKQILSRALYKIFIAHLPSSMAA
jgi:hypothetical protein